MSFLFALVFGLILIGSWVEWGRLFCGSIQNHPTRNWAWFAVIGLSVEIALGGILNYLKLISEPVLLVWVIMPLLLSVYRFDRSAFISQLSFRFKQKSNIDYILYGALFAFIFIQYVGSAAARFFMTHDDLHAYLVFPIRALQTGSLNEDPFNLRRMESSLGGMSFVDALFVACNNPIYTNLVDIGLGKILLTGFSFFIARELGLKRWPKFIFIALAVCMAFPWVNLTAVVLPESLFLFLIHEIWIMDENTEFFCWRRAVPMGLISGALVSMKSTYLVPVAMLGIAFFFSCISKSWKQKKFWIYFSSFAISFFFSLLFWMLAQHESANTYFYPLLGNGNHIPMPGLTVVHWGIASLQVLFYPENLIILLVANYLFFTASAENRFFRSKMVTMTLAILASSIVIGFSTGFTSVHRYSFPFRFPFALFLLGLVLSFAHTFQKRGLGIVFVLLLFIADERSWIANTSEFLSAIAAQNKNENSITLRSERENSARLYSLDREKEKLSKLQETVPAGAGIFAHVSLPMLFDFKRNPIFVADFPGGASPNPGMPVFGNPRELAEYFRAQNVHYLAYSYRDKANLTENLVMGLNRSKSLWPKFQLDCALAVQANLIKLGQFYSKIYDDGETFVIDIK